MNDRYVGRVQGSDVVVRCHWDIVAHSVFFDDPEVFKLLQNEGEGSEKPLSIDLREFKLKDSITTFLRWVYSGKIGIDEDLEFKVLVRLADYAREHSLTGLESALASWMKEATSWQIFWKGGATNWHIVATLRVYSSILSVSEEFKPREVLEEMLARWIVRILRDEKNYCLRFLTRVTVKRVAKAAGLSPLGRYFFYDRAQLKPPIEGLSGPILDEIVLPGTYGKLHSIDLYERFQQIAVDLCPRHREVLIGDDLDDWVMIGGEQFRIVRIGNGLFVGAVGTKETTHKLEGMSLGLMDVFTGSILQKKRYAEGTAGSIGYTGWAHFATADQWERAGVRMGDGAVKYLLSVMVVPSALGGGQ